MKTSFFLTKALLALSLLSQAQAQGLAVLGLHPAPMCPPNIDCAATITEIFEVFTGPTYISYSTVQVTTNTTYTITSTDFSATIVPTPVSQKGICEFNTIISAPRPTLTLTLYETTTAVFFNVTTTTSITTVRPTYTGTSECIKDLDPIPTIALSEASTVLTIPSDTAQAPIHAPT